MAVYNCNAYVVRYSADTTWRSAGCQRSKRVHFTAGSRGMPLLAAPRRRCPGVSGGTLASRTSAVALRGRCDQRTLWPNRSCNPVFAGAMRARRFHSVPWRLKTCTLPPCGAIDPIVLEPGAPTTSVFVVRQVVQPFADITAAMRPTTIGGSQQKRQHVPPCLSRYRQSQQARAGMRGRLFQVYTGRCS